jgi:hypothetical protein
MSRRSVAVFVFIVRTMVRKQNLESLSFLTRALERANVCLRQNLKCLLGRSAGRGVGLGLEWSGAPSRVRACTYVRTHAHCAPVAEQAARRCWAGYLPRQRGREGPTRALHSTPLQARVGGWVTTDATTTPEGDKRGYARAEPEPGPGALGNGTVHTTPQCGRLSEAAAAPHSMHVSGGGRPRPIASVPVGAGVQPAHGARRTPRQHCSRLAGHCCCVCAATTT